MAHYSKEIRDKVLFDKSKIKKENSRIKEIREKLVHFEKNHNLKDTNLLRHYIISLISKFDFQTSKLIEEKLNRNTLKYRDKINRSGEKDKVDIPKFMDEYYRKKLSEF